MVKLDMTEARASDMENRVDVYTVDSKTTDGVSDQKETEWTNPKWTTYWGYFNAVPDLKSAILMKAIWNVGKGYTADTPTQIILDRIMGWGKDTFEDILFNMDVIKRVGGESYAEIMRDDDGELLNLKPLDPGSMKTIVDEEGIIKRFEQINKIGIIDKITNIFRKKKNKKGIISFEPNEIFYLCNNRLADQIHGISDIEGMEKTILAEEENFEDMKKIMHRQAKPMIMFKLGTDKQSEIDAFVAKMDAATNKGENIYIPDDENSVSFEVVQVNVSQIIMEWRNDIRNKFYRTIGLPQVVPGGGGQSTESESKVIYLAFEQLVERDQRYIENQLWQQLAIKIDLIPPASIKNEMQTDTAKDANQGLNFQPAETTAGVGE